MEQDTEMTVADGLRELANWYEKNPNIAAPQMSIWINSSDGDRTVEKLAIIAKAFGNCTKDVNEYYIHVWREFGPFRVTAIADRDSVCKKIVTWKCPESLLAAIGKDALKELEEA